MTHRRKSTSSIRSSIQHWKAVFIKEIGRPMTAKVEVDGYVYERGVPVQISSAQKRRLEQLTQFQFVFREEA